MKRLTISIIGLFIGLASVTAQLPLKWQRTYGESVYNEGRGVIQLEDHGYIFLANENGIVGNTSIHLIRTDSLGIIRWEKRIADTTLRWGNDFKRTPDKGFVIAGYTYRSALQGYDLMILKTDSLGEVQWEQQLGGTDWDFGEAIMNTPDSGYLVVGKTYSYGQGDADIYIAKFSAIGDTVWTRTLGGDSLDFAVDCDLSADSNYWVSANTRSFGKGGSDGWVIKYNSLGDTLWSHFYGDTLDDQINSFKALPDKGFVFVGYTRSYGAINKDVWLMRIDSNMNFVWKMPEFWNIGPGNDVANHVELNDSLQYIISGYTDGAGSGGNDITINIMGEWNNHKFGSTLGSLGDEMAYNAFQTSDDGYLILGTTTEMGPSNTNLYVIKMRPNYSSDTTCIYTIGIDNSPSMHDASIMQVYPNPAHDAIQLYFSDTPHTDILIKIYNIQGICIQQLKNNGSNDNISIDISQLSRGMYFLETLSEGNRWVQKIVVE